MGAFCSTNIQPISCNAPNALEKSPSQTPRTRRLPSVKTDARTHNPPAVTTDYQKYRMVRSSRSSTGGMDEWTTADALDALIDARVGPASTTGPAATPSDYEKQRQELRERDRSLGFEHTLASAASPKEQRVDGILQDLKSHDHENVYAADAEREGFGGQRHPRFAGDHFLSNKALIEKSKVFRIARKLPKGAHLHIHFNACLLPDVLLDLAATMPHMYITSDIPLVSETSLSRSRIQFSIMAQTSSTDDLFSAAYQGREGAMRFDEFLAKFPSSFDGRDAMAWLRRRLVFGEEEAHGLLQTVDGAWQEFNTRTQMMKGLFNYETAYRKYTRRCLEDFVADNIQYAEIRPNFMETNQVWKDDGSAKMDNVQIMQMIIEEYESFQAEAEAKMGCYFGGMKIIYCCPRSYPRDKVANGLRQCLEFKLRWPQWIAGFDLVGEEAKGSPLNFFVPEFLQFQQDCKTAGVEIPFLFHCGETLEVGSETDANLLDALLLKSKRIGHGFALARHPYIMERMKKEGVCLELCPISNEVLGLTPRVGGHAMYNLLANNVHCTINSDNGTLFNSTLSHDFYQVIIGKADMTLYGWKQLIEWSLQHSCLSKDEYEVIYAAWVNKWDKFLDEVIEEFGPCSTPRKS